MPVPGGHTSKPTAGLTASSAGCLLQYVLLADISLADEPFCWQILLPRWATKSISNACVRFVMSVYLSVHLYQHIWRPYVPSLSNFLWELWQTVCRLHCCGHWRRYRRTDGRTDRPCPQMCAPTTCCPKWYSLSAAYFAFQCALCSGHGVGRHLHSQRSELRSIAV
jgi:hypothetical protein